MKTITIPAAQNGVDGIYAEVFGDAGFAVVSATSSFFIAIGTAQKFKISTGGQIGMQQGNSLGRVVFSNPTSTAIDVTIGDFGSKVQSIAPDLQNVQGVTNTTNPFIYEVWDSVAGFGDGMPFNISLALPVNKPFRRIWCHFDASTFSWPTGIDTLCGVAINFYLNGTLVHWLPVWFKFRTSPNQFGFGMNSAVDNSNRVARSSSLFYRNADGTGTVYEIYPFDLYVLADSVKLVQVGTDVGDQVGGNMRGLLSILSNEVPIV